MSDSKDIASSSENTRLFNIAVAYYCNADYRQAFNQFQSLYNQEDFANNVQLLYYLGMCYFYGHGTKQDISRGIKLLTAAADNNDVTACTILGSIYQLGDQIHRDAKKAFTYYKRAMLLSGKASNYFDFAQFNLIESQHPDISQTERENYLKEAKVCYRLAIQQGKKDPTNSKKILPEAEFSLAKILLLSPSQMEREEALNLFISAANRNHLYAIIYLGDLYNANKQAEIAVPYYLAALAAFEKKALEQDYTQEEIADITPVYLKVAQYYQIVALTNPPEVAAIWLQRMQLLLQKAALLGNTDAKRIIEETAKLTQQQESHTVELKDVKTASPEINAEEIAEKKKKEDAEKKAKEEAEALRKAAEIAKNKAQKRAEKRKRKKEARRLKKATEAAQKKKDEEATAQAIKDAAEKKTKEESEALQKATEAAAQIKKDEEAKAQAIKKTIEKKAKEETAALQKAAEAAADKKKEELVRGLWLSPSSKDKKLSPRVEVPSINIKVTAPLKRVAPGEFKSAFEALKSIDTEFAKFAADGQHPKYRMLLVGGAARAFHSNLFFKTKIMPSDIDIVVSCDSATMLQVLARMHVYARRDLYNHDLISLPTFGIDIHCVHKDKIIVQDNEVLIDVDKEAIDRMCHLSTIFCDFDFEREEINLLGTTTAFAELKLAATPYAQKTLTFCKDPYYLFTEDPFRIPKIAKLMAEYAIDDPTAENAIRQSVFLLKPSYRVTIDEQKRAAFLEQKLNMDLKPKSDLDLEKQRFSLLRKYFYTANEQKRIIIFNEFVKLGIWDAFFPGSNPEKVTQFLLEIKPNPENPNQPINEFIGKLVCDACGIEPNLCRSLAKITRDNSAIRGNIQQIIYRYNLMHWATLENIPISRFKPGASIFQPTSNPPSPPSAASSPVSNNSDSSNPRTPSPQSA